MMTSSGEGGFMDNRSISRKRKRLSVRFGTDELRHMGYTEDISSGGLFIQTAAVLRPGTRLQVQLTTNDGRQILLKGQVRWAKRVPPQLIRKIKGGMGVMITEFLEGEEIFRGCFPEEYSEACRALLR
jgi:Tfp pilus assembly protein PilZ